MRTKLKITEGIFPMPVLMVATYNEDDSVNVMNAAWGTMQERDTVALNLTETHKTVQNIKARGAFTVSIADAAHMVEADYFGVESGNKVYTQIPLQSICVGSMMKTDFRSIFICILCVTISFPRCCTTVWTSRRLRNWLATEIHPSWNEPIVILRWN